MHRFVSRAIKIYQPVRQSLRIQPIYRFSQQTELKRFSDAFLSGSNSAYIDQLFDRWFENPQSVPAQWDAYFKQVANYNQYDFVPEPSGGQVPAEIAQFTPQQQNDLWNYLAQCFRIHQLINYYRVLGHEHADVDPLNLPQSIKQIGKTINRSKIDYKSLDFTDADLDREFHIRGTQLGGLGNEKQRMKLRDLVNYLEKVYCGKIGYEYTHLTSDEQRDWIRLQIENYEDFKPNREQRLLTLQRLCRQYCFSTFLDRKFNTSKRFGIDGLDSLVSGLMTLVDTALNHRVEQVVFGMAHRGRLETLYSVFKKSPEEIMAEFQDLKGKYVEEDEWGNSGDVKYHLGCTNEVTRDGHVVRLNILPNPSHLEAVNPLVYGKVRALQDIMQDKEGKKAFGVLIHGDAAIAGQGIVYEGFQFADLQNYKSEGLIHVVANNQIGFTTVPRDARSGLYCTDVAKVVAAPVFHVNADEPDLVDRVFQLASEFRMKFKSDVVIDVVGYRRYGHNELDQPSFTQPIMYSKIKQTPPVFEKYSQKLIQEGLVTKEEVDLMIKGYNAELEEAYRNSRDMKFNINQWQPKPWEEIEVPKVWGAIKDTGVPVAQIKEISKVINHIDPNFQVHPQIKKFYELRQKAVEEDSGIDFATAEALAFGSLLKEGYGIRLSGQDVERATFSHRHAILSPQENPNNPKFMPLQNILPNDKKHLITVTNSHLSEFGVLGFEYGYSLANPNHLVLWEAQFGDFANGAQVMIDNYIASAETKWGVQSGLTLLLPNGMDGQGPEHSSGRVERFLQLSDDDPSIYERDHKIRPKRQVQQTNIQVCQPTTPANYFHVLRRQMRRQFRKPLICMTSKRLLRYNPANSFLAEFDQGRRFNTVYPEMQPDSLVKPNEITKVLICSGQVYYDILKKRQDLDEKTVAIIRIEQLAPFPYAYTHQILAQYTKAKFYWVQEEHENYGPWQYVRPRLNKILSAIAHEQKMEHHTIHHISRKPSASPATGFLKQHEKELDRILSRAFE